VQPTKPLDVDGVAATTVLTVIWAVALVVLLLSGVRLGDPNGWWLWVCTLGFLMGFPAIAFTRRRAAVYRAHAEKISASSSEQAGPADQE
jgi:Ca2+/H+ antiporter